MTEGETFDLGSVPVASARTIGYTAVGNWTRPINADQSRKKLMENNNNSNHIRRKNTTVIDTCLRPGALAFKTMDTDKMNPSLATGSNNRVKQNTYKTPLSRNPGSLLYRRRRRSTATTASGPSNHHSPVNRPRINVTDAPSVIRGISSPARVRGVDATTRFQCTRASTLFPLRRRC